MIRRGESGQVLALTAIAMIPLLGLAGTVIDYGIWAQASRLAQSCADSAALAASYDLAAGKVGSAIPDAQASATKNGCPGATVTLICWAGPTCPDAAKVVARVTRPAHFTKILGFRSETLAGRATALGYRTCGPIGKPPPPCKKGQPVPRSRLVQ